MYNSVPGLPNPRPLLCAARRAGHLPCLDCTANTAPRKLQACSTLHATHLVVQTLYGSRATPNSTSTLQYGMVVQRHYGCPSEASLPQHFLSFTSDHFPTTCTALLGILLLQLVRLCCVTYNSVSEKQTFFISFLHSLLIYQVYI